MLGKLKLWNFLNFENLTNRWNFAAFNVVLMAAVGFVAAADYCDPKLCPSGGTHVACNGGNLVKLMSPYVVAFDLLRKLFSKPTWFEKSIYRFQS